MTKDEKKDVNVWKVVTIIICVVSCVTLIAGYIYYKNELKIINSLYSDAQAMVVGGNTKFNVKSIELDTLKKQMSEIKDKNDLLKRDIELYIDTTHPKVPSVVGKEIAHQTVDLSRKYKVSPELIIGIIKVESAFNPMAVGPKTKYGHARGLMQVMPEWSKKFGLKDQYEFHNIDVAIEYGIKVFLIHLEEGKGDISTGLYYYVNKDKSYVGKVYSAMGKFVAFRSTIDEEGQNVETDIDNNGDSKEISDDKKGESNDNAQTRK